MSGRRANGEGTIRRIGPKDYEGQLRLTDPITGRRRRPKVRGTTPTEVTRKMRQVRERAEAGTALRDDRQTLGVFLERWQRTTLAASDRRATTQETYRTLLRVQVVPRLGGRRLDQLRPSHVEELILAMREAGKKPSTVRQVYSILRSALDDAVRDGMLVRNPAALVARPKVPRTDAAVLTIEQLQQLLSVTEGHRLRPVLVVLCTTALRRGEALALQWRDVDLEQGHLRVRGSLVRVGTELVVQPPKTERGWRTVDLTPGAVAVLRAQRARQVEERLAAGPLWSDHGYVFATEMGTPFDPRNVLRWYKSVAGTAGIPGALHTLRHSAATEMIAQGASLRLVADVLGHSSVQITGDIYAHVNDNQRRAAVHGLGTALGLGTTVGSVTPLTREGDSR